MRILVTGGAGYLGSILCEHLLDAGHEVRVMDRLYWGQHSMFHLCADPRFEFRCEDARDERSLRGALDGMDAIIPLAAIVGAPACDRDPETATSTNLGAIRSLAKLRAAGQWIVYPTTNSGYGTKSGETFCTEETPLEPISLYGRNKTEAERLLLELPQTITLRLATVFGMSPRMRTDLLVNHFVLEAVTAGYLVIFEKHFKRNYIHVRDVADCFLHCLANRQRMEGRAFNVGLEEANLSKAELAEAIQRYVPTFYVHYSEVGSDPDKRNYIVSNQRLREAGFVARRGLERGIPELIQGYRMLGRSEFANV